MSQYSQTPNPGQPLNLGAAVPNAVPVAMAQLFAIQGVYPVHETGGPAVCTLAMVHSLAGGNHAAFGCPACLGQPLRVMTYPALYSVLGATYGGDGQSSFDLPDLRGRVPIGNAPDQFMTEQTLPMTYMIAIEAAAGAAYPMVGAIGLFAGNFAPPGWMIADGSLLPISQNVPLFEVIGNAFGGDGRSSFALPNLSGSAAVGAGQSETGTLVSVGATVPAAANGGIAGIGINYLVAVAGEVPPDEGYGAFPDSGPVLGEVVAYGGSSVPGGWAAANGQLLGIADYQALFQLIGTTYGGDGEQTFALPDLRGRMISGLAE